MAHSGTNQPNRIFRVVNNLVFVRTQDPEIFDLLNTVVEKETLPAKPIVRQILLQGLRRRAGKGEIKDQI
jgi:hypothetical protein